MSESKMRLKPETHGAFCVLNANAKSQTRKYMKINVICTVDTRNSGVDTSYFCWFRLRYEHIDNDNIT